MPQSSVFRGDPAEIARWLNARLSLEKDPFGIRRIRFKSDEGDMLFLGPDHTDETTPYQWFVNGEAMQDIAFILMTFCGRDQADLVTRGAVPEPDPADVVADLIKDFHAFDAGSTNCL